MLGTVSAAAHTVWGAILYCDLEHDSVQLGRKFEAKDANGSEEPRNAQYAFAAGDADCHRPWRKYLVTGAGMLLALT